MTAKLTAHDSETYMREHVHRRELPASRADIFIAANNAQHHIFVARGLDWIQALPLTFLLLEPVGCDRSPAGHPLEKVEKAFAISANPSHDDAAGVFWKAMFGLIRVLE